MRRYTSQKDIDTTNRERSAAWHTPSIKPSTRRLDKKCARLKAMASRTVRFPFPISIVFKEAKRGWTAVRRATGVFEVGGRSRSLHFLSPLQVVRSGLLSGHALDEILQVPPESQFLQRVVQPACCDAEVGFVGGDVVDAMVFSRQDDVAGL